MASMAFNIVTWFILTIVFLNFVGIFSSIRHRNRRLVPLIFPITAPTRVQMIFGIGIPLEDLTYGAMTTGYVLKAEYFLPATVEQLRNRTSTNIAGRRRRRSRSLNFEYNSIDEHDELPHRWDRKNAVDSFTRVLLESKNVLSSYRWTIYKGLEGLANRLGLSGRSCVLKSICETAEIPYDYKNGIIGELMHILLTPSSSADDLSEHADNEYFQAERYGRSGVSCERVFRDCQRSLLDHLSKIF